MPCCECSSCQGNCAFGSVTYFTSTRSPGANVLSQNNKARGFVCKILSEEGVSLCSARCGYTSGTAAQTSWESLFTGFEFGYFCGLLLPYLVMYYTKLLRTLFSEFYPVAKNAPLAYTEGVYITCTNQRCLVTYPCMNEWSFITNLEQF